MKKITNILFCGVGGQGLMLSSTILSNVLFDAGYDIKKSEIHGMSQRGGSIISFIRFGNEVLSPTFDMGQCDILVGFEKLETLRNKNYLNSKSRIILNNYALPPTTVYNMNLAYPDDTIIESELKKITENIKIINGSELAEELGNIKAANIIILGYLSKLLDIDNEMWINTIKKNIKPKFIDLNIEAFSKGVKLYDME